MVRSDGRYCDTARVLISVMEIRPTMCISDILPADQKTARCLHGKGHWEGSDENLQIIASLD